MSQNIEFECLAIESQIKLLNIYNSHFTGSNLWEFESETVQQLINSWNVNIRIICKLPIETHKYIVERISECKHIKQKLFSRYVTFLKSLALSEKPALSFLLNLSKTDIRSVTGSNLRFILNESKVYIIPGVTSKQSFSNYEAYQVPAGQEWKLPLLISLIKIREGAWTINFDEEDTDDLANNTNVDNMIKDVCTQ